ncbi:MAG: energy-coupling factor transporter transmembrane protein EcfT [Deltaproteobacteria bacterium]|nr:energy-coupling factor transporter transmembrane protein EcfT [Deltaproteobacteria bacterium]
MATGITAFHFCPGNTPVHSLDPRFKLILMAAGSLAVLDASTAALAFLSAAVLLVSLIARLDLLSAVRDLRYFFFLLAVVFTARAIFTPGEPLVQIWVLKIGRAGIADGAVVCWRFLVVVVMGLILIATTRVADIKRSAAWFFRPVPGIPERRVATMLGLLVRFIPVIFARAKEVSAAQSARCIGARRNPFYRLRVYALPLLRGVFRDADNLAVAMEARAYGETGDVRMAKARAGDWAILLCGICLCACILILK